MITPVTIAIAQTQRMKPVKPPKSYNYWVDVAWFAVSVYTFGVGVLMGVFYL